LSDSDSTEKVKEKRGLIDRLQDVFMQGYSIKEDLRTMDKTLRDSYFDDLRELRHRWEGVYLEVLDSNVSGLNRRFKGVIQRMDRLMEKIRRGTYGYSGLFDRRGRIEAGDLERVYEFDKSLSGDMEKLEATVGEVISGVADEEWKEVKKTADSVRNILEEIEEKWREREKRFRQIG
jgi:hypothetical protein